MLTDQERLDVGRLVYALTRVQWGAITDQKCPVCGRAKAYGHVCSCPVRIALRGAGKQGWEPTVK